MAPACRRHRSNAKGVSDLWLVNPSTGTQIQLTQGEQAGGVARAPNGR